MLVSLSISLAQYCSDKAFCIIIGIEPTQTSILLLEHSDVIELWVECVRKPNTKLK